jgi:hypothetical protein
MSFGHGRSSVRAFLNGVAGSNASVATGVLTVGVEPQPCAVGAISHIVYRRIIDPPPGYVGFWAQTLDIFESA